MEPSFTLASAGNTINPALFVLRKKGYHLLVTNLSDGSCLYIAQKDRRRFVGNSAPELLGLVTMWEHLGDFWRDQLSEIPDILPEVILDEDEL